MTLQEFRTNSLFRMRIKHYTYTETTCRLVLPAEVWDQFIRCCKAYQTALVSLKIISRNEEEITLLIKVPHNDFLPFLKHVNRYE